MRILALDTSSKAASCALWEDGVLRGEFFLNGGLTHSQTILPMVQAMLRECRCAINTVDRIAVSAGPGSFTGLRIGLSAAKGMALAGNKPCVAVSTLEALAWNLAGFDGYVVPVMDARRSQVYTALFHCVGGEVQRLEPDGALLLVDLGKRLEPLQNTPILLVGDGAPLALETLHHIQPALRLCPEALRHQRAGSVAAVAAGLEPCSAAALEPVYLRLPQAERERLEREKEAK